MKGFQLVAVVVAVFVSMSAQAVQAQSDFNFVRTGLGTISQDCALITRAAPDYDSGTISLYSQFIGIGSPGGAGLTGSGTSSYSIGPTDTETVTAQSGMATSPDNQPQINCSSSGQFAATFLMEPWMWAIFFPRTTQNVYEDLILEQSPSSTLSGTDIEVKLDAGYLAGPGVNGAVSGVTMRFDGIIYVNGYPNVIITGSNEVGIDVSVLNEWGTFDDFHFDFVTGGANGVGGFDGIYFHAADGDHIESFFTVDTPIAIWDNEGDDPSSSFADAQFTWNFTLSDTSATGP